MRFSQREGLFISETHTKAIEWSFTVEKILAAGNTKYQEYQIVEIPRFGKTLFLDWKIQSSLLDEYIFHECMSQPAMTLHPNPKTVFVAGGGEGATLREALSHNTVTKAVMVDIDAELVEMTKKHMPEWHRGAFDDPRTTLLHTDARKYLEETDERFDVILSDLPDPVEEGPAIYLFTKEYFSICRDRLTEDGVYAMQAGCANLSYPECFAACVQTLKEVFPIVRPYYAIMTTFMMAWGFVLASNKYDPLQLTESEIAKRHKERGVSTRYYTPRFHTSVFTPPDYLLEAIEKNSRVVTDAEPFVWSA
ncbi:MAG TPA: polyamine aminopropyltransferase [Fimbriimonadales bacterium]|nr:polyamine aminopropyltransferase [Fimbriimonadales bacterium]